MDALSRRGLVGLATRVADPLRSRRGRRRVLVVFAPAPEDPDLRRQQQELRAAGAGLTERDIDVLLVVGPAAPGSDDAALRAACTAPEGQFSVVLIGKDGGQKLRDWVPLTARRLFATIDAMPMRRDEMAPGATPGTTRGTK